MKKLLTVLAFTACAAPLALRAQPLVDPQRMIQIFSVSAENDSAAYTVTILNDKTVEALFGQSPAKIALRTKARMTTVFFVQATTKKDMEFDPHATVDWKAQTLEGIPAPIANFAKGKVAKGQRIQGMIEMPRKVDLFDPFKFTINKVEFEFRINEQHVRDFGNK